MLKPSGYKLMAGLAFVAALLVSLSLAPAPALAENPLGITPTSVPPIVPGANDPILTKAVNFNLAQVGDRVIFTLTASNSGSADINNVRVEDSLPPIFDYALGTTTQGTVTYDPATRLIVFNIGTLAPGQTVTMIIQTVVNSVGLPPEQYRNVALIYRDTTLVGEASVTVQLIPTALASTGEGPGPNELAAMLFTGALIAALLLVGAAGVARGLRVKQG